MSYQEILDNVRERDHIDETREESPLKKASDAVELDNSNMNRKEQLDWIVEKMKEVV